MSPQRRDSEGRRQVGPTWESLVERQIREAMEEGAFTGLPFVGQRLPIEEDSAAGEWALAHRMLKNAGAAPPWIESDKETRRHLAEIERVVEAAAHAAIVSRARLRRDLVEAVTAANHAIERLNSEAPTDRQHRRLRDPEIELGRLEVAFRRR